MQDLSGTAKQEKKWGADLTIFCQTDKVYLPGAYALFNSAVLNEFEGNFNIMVPAAVLQQIPSLPKHQQLQFVPYEPLPSSYQYSANRMACFKNLSPGKYLWLDSDVVIERPCGQLFQAIDDGLVVSTEPVDKYDPFDIVFYRQAKEAGLSNNFRYYPYVNAGMLGFSLPRDARFINKWVEIAVARLNNLTVCQPGSNWFFLEQDILNLLIKQPDTVSFSVSTRMLEFGHFAKVFQDRPFPWQSQGDLRPADQIKYLIHGASLPRPWLKRVRQSIKGKIAAALEPLGLLAFVSKPSPYERAWAYYACRENLPIPVSAWAFEHDFHAYKNPLWCQMYGLSS
jgi:hypothetical protein